MSLYTVAGIGVENCPYSADKLFSYLISEELKAMLSPGMRVMVPFGNGSSQRQGMVFSVEEREFSDEELSRIKTVERLIDTEPILTQEMISLALWLRERYFCTYFAAAKATLPGGICVKTEKVYSLNNDVPPEKTEDLGEAEKLALAVIAKQKKPVRASFLLKRTVGGDNDLFLRKMVKKGILNEDSAAFERVGDLSVQTVSLAEDFDIRCAGGFTEKQQSVIDLLFDGPPLSVKEICYYTGVGEGVVKRLITAGVLSVSDTAVTRSPVILEEDPPAPKRVVLSEQQEKVFRELLDAYRRGEERPVLLHGITGSGKTNVYLELIDRVLADGRNVIVLVPEISLTPQTFSLFRARYGRNIAVLHSALSPGERRDEWKRIRRGDARVIIGTRSAVFAPVENVGLIVIDEEQEHTYKSESSPRYNAKEAAKFRAAYNGGLLVLVSATPSVESYARALSGKYLLTELTERYGTAVLPGVEIIDVSDKNTLPPFFSVSLPLKEELKKNLENGEQSILLVNRRGYNTFVSCPDCKQVLSCPKCSISLTYHAANHRLMCHYCGYSVPYTEKCPSCGAANMRYAGAGTQKIMQELQMSFPSARIVRMDADSTIGKNSHDKILGAFAAGEYDILLGTQMVAKGLDFENVTLVGIVSADKELYNNDFRSAERTFDLITQVVGRAGRGKRKGRAVIQTTTPDNSTLTVAADQDYRKFYDGEIILRKAMIYPPFCDICEIGFSGLGKGLVETCADVFFEKLRKLNEEQYADLKLIVLGPLPPRVSKINNFYRQRLLIKCRNSQRFRAFIDTVLRDIYNDRVFKDVSIYADINPENIN